MYGYLPRLKSSKISGYPCRFAPPLLARFWTVEPRWRVALPATLNIHRSHRGDQLRADSAPAMGLAQKSGGYLMLRAQSHTSIPALRSLSLLLRAVAHRPLLRVPRAGDECVSPVSFALTRLHPGCLCAAANYCVLFARFALWW